MTQPRGGGLLLAKVHHLSGRVFARLLKRRGLDEINPAQGRILYVLWQADPLPLHELARRTGLAKPTLSAMLDRLERDGHVERRPDPADRRGVLIHRTAKDEAFRQAFLAVSEEMNALWYDGLAEAERDAFESALARILSNLEREADDGCSP
ncbi:MAG: MarR family transcriptional regulator [Alphaproteobacteria bacterium]|nr:MarR family transcriptional regulator [Alphaproteobacteria bacterium]